MRLREDNGIRKILVWCLAIVSLCDEYVYEGAKTLDEVIAEAQHILDMRQEETVYREMIFRQYERNEPIQTGY